MIKDNYCRAVYKGLFIKLEPDNQARLSACCINTPGPYVRTIDFENDSYLQAQRQQFDQGQKPDSCYLCWEKERGGLISRRQRQCPPFEDKDPHAVELVELNYHVSPLCNAKCITCDSSQSSLWAAEDAKFGEVKAILRSYNRIRQNDLDLSTVDFTKLKLAYFNGGEPFLSSDISRVLKVIKQQQGSLANLNLSITTNASVWPQQEDVDLWNECQYITISCSVEAVGSAFEYIRYPLSWTEVKHNVERFAKLFNRSTIVITPNIGIHNVLEYPKLVDWFETLKGRYYLEPSVTYGALNFGHVSPVVKMKLLAELPDDPRYQIVKNFITGMPNGVDDDTWRRHLNWIDQRRNLDWRQSLVELARVIDN